MQAVLRRGDGLSVRRNIGAVIGHDFERIGRHIFEFSRRHGDAPCEVLQRAPVIILSDDDIMRAIGGRRIFLIAVDYRAQAKPRRRDGKHSAELAAAENADGVARFDNQ
ncbi:MAG: hypothetical protein Tsb0010_00470 [Parvularculaceae bacterium]